MEKSSSVINRSKSMLTTLGISSSSPNPYSSNGLGKKNRDSYQETLNSVNGDGSSLNISRNISNEYDHLSRENRKLQDQIDEKSIIVEASESEIKATKQENFRLKMQMKILQKQIYDRPSENTSAEDFNNILAEERKKYYLLYEKYQVALQNFVNREKDMNTIKNLSEEIKKQTKQIETLRENIAEKNREIYKLGIDLRRTEPQESIDFQAQLEKIKLVLSSHKEPAIEIKKEIDDLKHRCENLKNELKTKDGMIDYLKNTIKQNEKEMNKLNEKFNESDAALERVSCQLIESKANESELMEQLRVLKAENQKKLSRSTTSIRR
ncbi:hypothetical protein RF11_16163 [Thelohanellus kitauei]|uniref:Uncharacterized protein n=1 Tax=Thelohanellus kitauei TaxID=669202 RepID=A0A0C2JYG3_THEKT|nr:hypothetical protein RF11_16163 [Thelohanellus kitauei]